MDVDCENCLVKKALPNTEHSDCFFFIHLGGPFTNHYACERGDSGGAVGIDTKHPISHAHELMARVAGDESASANSSLATKWRARAHWRLSACGRVC